MTWEIRQGDALEQLRLLPAGSVQTCITSPPYFGLRDYGTAEWEGGDPECDHRPPTLKADRNEDRRTFGDSYATHPTQLVAQMKRTECGKCGASKTDHQVGLEQTPDEYVARLVEVFREVRRVLRDDGTLWLNLGDSYARNGGDGECGPNAQVGNTRSGRQSRMMRVPAAKEGLEPAAAAGSGFSGLKQKDLLGIPWMVAFALRADGWYLRSDIVWSKPNPMPESVTDRPTKAHEYIFMLSKNARYFYDADAIREQATEVGIAREGRARDTPAHSPPGTQPNRRSTSHGDADWLSAGRNKRSVWTVATQPFPGAHFAVFPPKLIEPCVLAGSSPRACGVCGAPWVRVVEATAPDGRSALVSGGKAYDEDGRPLMGDNMFDHGVRGSWNSGGQTLTRRTVGWEPSCSHTDDNGQSVVLDPFAGAGTTGLVALQHGRSFIGIELNPAYVEMASERIATAERLGFRPPERGPDQIVGQLSLEGDAA